MGCTTLSQFDEPLDNFDVIGIDEGQFFPDIVSFADSMATAGKIVIVAALDGTFQRKVFTTCILVHTQTHPDTPRQTHTPTPTHTQAHLSSQFLALS